MISGALLINKDYSISAFIRKKFNRIFIPYIFWAVILVLFSLLLINLGIKADVINTSRLYLLLHPWIHQRAIFLVYMDDFSGLYTAIPVK